MTLQLLPVAYDPAIGHPRWADRGDLRAIGDEFATPGDALRRLAYLRDSGRHSCLVPERMAFALMPFGGWS